MVSTEDTLALRYNDVSPLENYHCTSAWSILNKEETNIIENLSATQKSEFRAMLINSVLLTDPSRTVELMSKFEGIMDKYDKSSTLHRITLGQFLLKCADVSNPCRPFPISRYWAEMIQAEFHLQVCIFFLTITTLLIN